MARATDSIHSPWLIKIGITIHCGAIRFAPSSANRLSKSSRIDKVFISGVAKGTNTKGELLGAGASSLIKVIRIFSVRGRVPSPKGGDEQKHVDAYQRIFRKICQVEYFRCKSLFFKIVAGIVGKTLGIVRFGTVRNQDSQAFSKWQLDAVFNQITRSS